jgi:hypothetical protein
LLAVGVVLLVVVGAVALGSACIGITLAHESMKRDQP